MNITEILLETAKADTDRLLANDKQGDVIDQRRNVHFLLVAPDKEKALQLDALEGAVQGAHENLLAFLKTQHQM